MEDNNRYLQSVMGNNREEQYLFHSGNSQRFPEGNHALEEY